MKIAKEFRWEMGHRLPKHDGACRNVHGHSYRMVVEVEGEIDPGTGMVMDFADIKMAFKPILDRLDHYYLNEIPGLENPTSEVLAHWIWARIKPTLPILSEVVVSETCTSRCVYRGG